jgi:hypothetical protein
MSLGECPSQSLRRVVFQQLPNYVGMAIDARCEKSCGALDILEIQIDLNVF